MTAMLCYIHWNPSVTIGPFRWYALCWITGLTIGYFIVRHLYDRQGITMRTLTVNGKKTEENVFDPLFIYVFLGVIIGARLGHCLFYQPDYFLSSWPHFVEMLLPIHFTDDGGWRFTGYEGLASHGGVAGIIIAIFLYVKRTGITALTTLDNIAIAAPLTACCIRLGNLMNSEIIGKPTDVPWAFVFERVDMVPRHPGQLYEALAYFLFFFVGWHLWKKHPERVGSGYFFGLCIAFVFIFRFFIEFVKEVQEEFEASMALDMGQLLSIPFALLGVFFMVRGVKKSPHSVTSK